MTDRTRVLFVNSGILGQGTFSKFVREAMSLEPGIDPGHMNLSEALRPVELPGVRVLRGIGSYSGDWAEAWRHADLFVMPTHQGAFPLVFREAAAAGIARIGTVVNAVPEMITDGVSGLLAPAGDRAALVRALGTLLRSPDLRHRLGAAGREQVVRDAHPDDYRRRLACILHDAAHRGSISRVA
jgi:glycosyltransferase involved in cell wall biosynthesis